MTSRKAVMKSTVFLPSPFILAVFDNEDAKRPALQEVFQNGFGVGIVVDGVRA